MSGLIDEALSDDSLDDAIQFVRDANPFSQHTWGWDMGRFIDFRWGSNNIRAEWNPDWFGTHCRVFRDGSAIRALAIAEEGSEEACILTRDEDPGLVAHVLGLQIERHRKRGVGIALEFCHEAEWLREVCRTARLSEEPESGCEWEYDLATVDTAVSVPEGFKVETLLDSPETDRRAIAECIERAFDATRDLEPILHNIETNPAFRPELSVFARSPEGVIAAYCRGTVDPVNGVSSIDPVCTHPDYQRLGLGKAVARTAMATQRKLGGRFSYIGSAPPPAPGTFLYRSLGPSHVFVACEWKG